MRVCRILYPGLFKERRWWHLCHLRPLFSLWEMVPLITLSTDIVCRSEGILILAFALDCVAWICEVITPHYLYKALLASSWSFLALSLSFICQWCQIIKYWSSLFLCVWSQGRWSPQELLFLWTYRRHREHIHQRWSLGGCWLRNGRCHCLSCWVQ